MRYPSRMFFPSPRYFSRPLRGAILGAFWALSIGIGRAADSTNTPSAADAHQLAEQIVAAYGGIDAVKHSIDVGTRTTGKVVQYSTISGAANTFDCAILTQGVKMRIDMEVMGQPLVTAYDGKHSWMKQGEQIFRSSDMAEKSIREEIDHGLMLLGKLLDQHVRLQIVGHKQSLGHDCDLLEIKMPNDTPTLFYADHDSHMILQSEYAGVDTEQGVDARKTYNYEDYRPVAGSLEPYRVTEYCNQRKASVLDVDKVDELNIEPATFEMPQENLSPVPPGQSVTLPFNLLFNEILITARVNDSQDLTFVVDTGATQSVLDNAVAANFGEAKHSTFEMTTGSGSVPLSYMNLKALNFKNIKMDNVVFAVTDLAAFSQIIGHKPAGLIGANLLHQFLITIDYDKRLITFANPHNVFKPLPGGVKIPAKPALGLSGLLVDTILDGHPLPLLVDTGAAFNNISEKLAKPMLHNTLLPVGSIQGLDGRKVAIGAVRFDTFQLGPLKTIHPVFSIAPDGGAPAGIISSSGLGILGNPFWQHFRLTIDYLNNQIILDRSAEQEAFELLYERFKTVQNHALVYGFSEKQLTSFRALQSAAKSKHCPPIVGLCIASTAGQGTAYKGKSFADEATRKVVTDEFRNAELLAASNPRAHAQVLAMSADFYLGNFPRAVGASLARTALMAASDACGTEPNAFVVTAKLLRLGHNDTIARELANQALMIDPPNWSALWLKYEITPAENPLHKQVAEQIKRYYPDAPQTKKL